MRKAAIRVSQSGPELGICAVKGYFGTTLDDEYCPRCREEIEALDQWRRVREARELCAFLRRQERAERMRRIISVVLRRAWMIDLGIVLCGLVYLGAVYGAALLEWMGAR